MSTSVFPLPPSSAALDEEAARAELYGLLAQLYYAAPGAALLSALRGAPTGAPQAGDCLQEPWQQLVDAARALSDAAIAQEFAHLFGGVGKPALYLYGSHYLSGFLNEKPLARLRGDLDRMGLARAEAIPETEDHIACLCEAMRYLIAGDDPAVCTLGAQRNFFTTHLQPWVRPLCDALQAHPLAHFYCALARFTRAFMAVETQGFEMFDGA
ncbi:molecular chaperone [Verminephrobacter aporrectodeae subsp. tuberculatae]|uniref:TorD/DmsD family molecular chaperone n=1 Tax=Verminephrobacter aporrectodeae TaxID=1110389 RepID=UPI00224449AE|nr:molecular chaperone TorD family protein [Verminephrobacter aporrectodeae]MCW8165916.1 molecular chaperone [Verminephrobacter aporrectodeae subsp. tuberculatae]MCW8169939.1 molecular chaperone [Verminephrobacter aporrectodeae subsp. tuberculatae]